MVNLVAESRALVAFVLGFAMCYVLLVPSARLASCRNTPSGLSQSLPTPARFSSTPTPTTTPTPPTSTTTTPTTPTTTTATTTTTTTPTTKTSTSMMAAASTTTLATQTTMTGAAQATPAPAVLDATPTNLFTLPPTRDGAYWRRSCPVNLTAIATGHATIIQYGVPRTASTFQFTLLCNILRLRYPSSIRPLCVFSPSACNFSAGRPTLNGVVKCHKATFSSARSRGPPIPVFRTVATDAQLQKDIAKLDRNGTPQCYARTLSRLVSTGTDIVDDYTSVFELSPDEVAKMKRFFELWQIIRQCCSTQMSKHWRAYLWKQYHSDWSSTEFEMDARVVGVCRQSNLTQTEEQIVNEFPRFLTQASQKDPPTRPGLCACMNRLVGVEQLRFNDNRYTTLARQCER